jgi:hypothetical protein
LFNTKVNYEMINKISLKLMAIETKFWWYFIEIQTNFATHFFLDIHMTKIRKDLR